MSQLKILCIASLLFGSALTAISRMADPYNPNPPFDISQYPSVDTCPNTANALQRNPQTKSKCKCTHYLFALDESTSMASPYSKWEGLISVMNNFTLTLAPISNYFLSVFEFSDLASLPIEVHIDPTFSTDIDMHLDYGGTNFGSALLRFIDIISEFMNENTCIVMITDGQAPLPTLQIVEILAILGKVRENGCKTCAICFFISSQSNNSVPPLFKQLCQRLDAKLYSSDQYNFKREFPNAFRKEVGGFSV